MKGLKRQAVLALILTPEGEILLIRAEEPVSGRQVWFTPGGGLGPYERPEASLRHELHEETGLRDFQIGPPVWTRRHLFDWAAQHIMQDETFYLIRSKRFTPTMADNPDPSEGAAFREFHWWTVDQISVSKDLFAPRRLAEYLRVLIEHRPPPKPVDTGI